MNIEQRNEMIDMISDLSKDVYGFRMRYDYDSMSDDELSEKFDDLQNELVDVLERDKEGAAKALDEFNATVENYMNEYNLTVEKAIEWMLQGYGLTFCERDLDYMLWECGLNHHDASYIIRSMFFEELLAA